MQFCLLNWPLQLLSQDYNPASYNTHVVCFKFIQKRQNLKVDAERQIFEELFSQSLIVFAIRLLRGSWQKKNVFYFILFEMSEPKGQPHTIY